MLSSAFYHPHFSIRHRPSASAIRRHPVRTLQRPSTNCHTFHPFMTDTFSTNLPSMKEITETWKVSSSDVIFKFSLTQDHHDMRWQFPNLWKLRNPLNYKDENNTYMACKTTSARWASMLKIPTKLILSASRTDSKEMYTSSQFTK